MEQVLVLGPQAVDFLFDGAAVAPARKGLGTLGVELHLLSADLGVAEAELAGGFGVGEALLGDELHRLELVLVRKGATDSVLGLGHG